MDKLEKGVCVFLPKEKSWGRVKKVLKNELLRIQLDNNEFVELPENELVPIASNLDKLIEGSFEYKIIKKVSNLKIPAKQIPASIRQWVKETLDGHGLQQYNLKQGVDVQAGMPWHEADSEFYKMFKLMPDGSAQPTDFSFERSGLEGDGSVTGKEVSGKTKVPSGFVIVVVGTYPKRATIYTAEDAQLLLPKKADLSDEEIMILFWARAYVSSSRPVFKDKTLYDKLVEKGLLKKNKAISLDGRNVLEDKEIKDRLNKLQNSNFDNKLESRY